MGVTTALWGLAWLSGCTAGEDPISYTLTLLPVVADKNQDPFDGVDSHSLQVVGPNNDIYQEMTLQGTEVSLGGLDVMAGDTLTYRGSTAHQVTAFGRTAPITIGDGETSSVPIWVGEVDAMGWLLERDSKEGIFQGAVSSLGDGRFLLFGGEDRATGGNPDDAFDTISLLDLGTPDDEPVFVEIGTMPAYTDGGSSHTERVGLSATTLNDADELAGQVLVAGGTSQWLNGANVTGTAFFYDPETGDIEELGVDAWMGEERFDHVAVQNHQGDVVIFGGWGRGSGGGVSVVSYIDYFDRSERAFQKLGPFDLGVYGAADVLGTTEGVLHCGGIDISSSTWYTLDACYLAAPNEDINQLATPLPMDLGLHTLTQVDEGKVLIAGGVHVGEAIVDLDTQVDASAKAWVYDHDKREFDEVDDMSIARAGHAAIPLSGNRVLVVGGVESSSQFPFGDTYATGPLACGEIFHLSDGSWEPADNCREGDAVGTLEAATVLPLVANDPELGALVMGGSQSNWAAATQIGFWTHRN